MIGYTQKRRYKTFIKKVEMIRWFIDNYKKNNKNIKKNSCILIKNLLIYKI